MTEKNAGSANGSDSMKTQIEQLLHQYSHDEEEFFLAIEELSSEKGAAVYPALFRVLTELDIPGRSAERQWHEVLKYRDRINSALGKKISIRSALLDYFFCIEQTLQNPKVIEISQYEKLSQMASFDELTGLLNRHVYRESLAREITRAERHAIDISLLFFDLDDFKQVNDQYGHEAGDRVLKAVAEVILRNIRYEDIAVRYGGEEIILLLPQTGKKDAFTLAERIRREVEELRVPYGRHQIRVTLSGGLASYPYDATDITTIQNNADKALYMAKRGGKNMIRMFSSDMRRYVRVKLDREIYVDELGFSAKNVCRARSRDISRGGMLFEAGCGFDVGTRVQTQVELGPDTSLLLTAKVVRTKPLAAGRFETGISFSDLDRKTASQLFGYIFRQTHGHTTAPRSLQ